MKILITNSVPLNGGDEALLRATVGSLLDRWPDCRITVLCKDLARARAHIRDIALASDLEFAGETAHRALRAAVRASSALLKLRGLQNVHRGFEELAKKIGQRSVLKLYRDADVVLSAPGGFFHDFYPVEERLRGIETALALGKPVILFAQSVGPFWKPRSIRRVAEIFNRVSRICVREAVSAGHLAQCGVDAKKIRETADAAFLWRKLRPDLFRAKSGAVKKIALAFRTWPLNKPASAAATVGKARVLCEELLREPARELVFLSTCQGLPHYADDSLLASEIVQKLPPSLRARCNIDRVRRTPAELIDAFGRCDAFIGMRLHACILAMLGGTPAMGLGYEDKTRGIYAQLGYGSYQVDFDSDENAWLECARKFLGGIGGIRASLPGALDRACARAEGNLDEVAKWLPQAAVAP